MNNINQKIHYYGWNRIQQYIQRLYISDKVYIIDYVDIYFLKHNINVIEKDWIGIIHHTISKFSSNNICNLFKNDIFIKSLKTCKALIALSEYNKIHILNELHKLDININVYVIKHPMPPLSDNLFDIKLFEQNLDIYNIGGWLRNPYTIYHTNFCYNNKIINKHKLKGYSMDQYFPPADIDYYNIVNNILTNNDNNNDNITINNNNIYSHPNNSANYFIKYITDYIKFIKTEYNQLDLINKLINNHKSITVHDYLENDNYLDLLISNIIFCDYIDCSASNTIIECISTGTPIILNRIPAIVEYLGDDYPLYFDNIYNNDTNTYYLTTDNILQAHYHLLNIRNNNNFDLNNFILNLTNIIKSSCNIKKKKKIFYYDNKTYYIK